MKSTLEPGLIHEFKFRVPETKTVPNLFPEAAEFQLMPRVFATGYLVGLVEWACMKAIESHLDWPAEQTVGTAVQLTHSAATPPGLTITVRVRLEGIDGRKLSFSFEADDGVDTITTGTHERFVVDAEKFRSRVATKAIRATNA